MATNLKLKLVNYKLIENMEADLSGYDLVIFGADNGKGKSSIINGILENFMAKAISSTPLTIGEKEGEKRITTTDNTGSEITVIHTFSKEKPTGSFYAMKNGTPIRSVNEIRSLLGETNVLTVDELFQMCKTTDGRRKFIRTYLYQSMSDSQYAKLNEIENDIRPRTGKLVLNRQTEAALIEKLESIIKNSLTEEELIMISRKDAYEATEKQKMEELEAQKELYSRSSTPIKPIKDVLETCSEFMTEENIKKLTEVLNEIEKTSYVLKVTLDEMEKFMEEKIKPKMNALRSAVTRNENLTTTKKSLDESKQKLKEIEDKIDKYTNDKNVLLKSIVLPEGVVIHSESDFSIKGLDFSQADISESEAWMLLAELTIKQFPAAYMRMGSASLYNHEKRKKLAELANKYNKLIALERVIDHQEEIKVEGYAFEHMDDAEVFNIVQTDFKAAGAPIIQDDTNTPTKHVSPIVEPKNAKKEVDMDKPRIVDNLFE